MPTISKLLIGLLFFLSGFCSLLYQTVWLRLAFAQFGVITPVVSAVIAIFMLGLGLGSWLGGQYAGQISKHLKQSSLIIYALIETIIGLGAFVVPNLFSYGSTLLTGSGEINSWLYLLSSALVISIAILPFATAMGATYPIAMKALNEQGDKDKKTFGFLYAANTAGAVLGTLGTVFVFIEVLGFNRTLGLAALLNFLIAITATIINKQNPAQSITALTPVSSNESHRQQLRYWIILFVIGFCSIAMEVVWTRSFVVVLGSLVYSFATLLAVYLFSNWLGATIYCIDARYNKVRSLSSIMFIATICACLPILASNPLIFRPLQNTLFSTWINWLVLFSITPFAAVLGYLTPCLVNKISQGDPAIAGKAYAINIIGCVLGPLCAGYLLLPIFGTRSALILLTVPLGILAVNNMLQAFILGVFLILISVFCSTSWEEGGSYDWASDVVMHRDYAATTLALNNHGCKWLFVNGQGMTSLNTICKWMAHLPAAFHDGSPKSVLVICFGMGTSFRSALTWDSKVTVAELVPGVRDSFSYYHSDAGDILKNPNGRIVIDDGRRFLRRTDEKYDVILLDPPPPQESAGSSLLYTTEFYQLVKEHLKPGGILNAWSGNRDDIPYVRAFMRSIAEEFPYTKVYGSMEPNTTHWGYHVLCSENPIPDLTVDQFIARMPIKAKNDLVEWFPGDGHQSLRRTVADVLSQKTPIDYLMVADKAYIITDDHPFNEYFYLRRTTGKQVYFTIPNITWR